MKKILLPITFLLILSNANFSQTYLSSDKNQDGNNYLFFNEQKSSTKHLNQIVPDWIYKINSVTGDTIYIGRTGLNKVTQDIVFDTLGILYGLIKGGTDSLITIDTLTGIASKLGSLNRNDLYAIAMLSEKVTGVNTPQENQFPIHYILDQNYPNPFNPITKIKYSIPQLSKVVIKVFDILGNEIETLANQEKPAGIYEIT